MNPDKKIILKELVERVNDSPFVIVLDYNGMTVPQFKQLRDQLAENTGTECHVAKNTFMKRVLADVGLPDIGDQLVGQTAFVTGNADVCAVSKTIFGFAKKVKKPAVKVGILDGVVLDADQVKALADLPPREVMLAILLGTINAPASQLVRTINEPGASLARVIQAKFNPAA